ncbi:MAG: hypothetical protein BIFFINMI_03180 [Phycisphaerae bacterium]|nr:hypothetical protein [Phycisphaerae bacterium]
MTPPRRASRTAAGMLAGLTAACVVAFALTGCPSHTDVRLPPLPPANPAVEAVTSLRAGVGWASGSDDHIASPPREAFATAADAARLAIGQATPKLVIVWDNFDFADDAAADRALAAVAERFPRALIYGGQVDWPMSATWTTAPSVQVLALGGPWQVTAADDGPVRGREAEVGRALALMLHLPMARPPVSRPGSPPPAPLPMERAGQFVLVFGDLAGRSAGDLLAAIVERAGPRLVLAGGAGGGAAGSGRQYVAGKVRHNEAWAVRLVGPFRARAAFTVPKPSEDDIEEMAALTMHFLTDEPADGRRPAAEPLPWRLLLMCESAGHLAYLKQPSRLVTQAVGHFGRQSKDVVAAGWAGQSQLGPGATDHVLSDSVFGLTFALIEPLPKPSAAPPPAAPPEPAAPPPPAPTTQEQ